MRLWKWYAAGTALTGCALIYGWIGGAPHNVPDGIGCAAMHTAFLVLLWRTAVTYKEDF